MRLLGITLQNKTESMMHTISQKTEVELFYKRKNDYLDKQITKETKTNLNSSQDDELLSMSRKCMQSKIKLKPMVWLQFLRKNFLPLKGPKGIKLLSNRAKLFKRLLTIGKG